MLYNAPRIHIWPYPRPQRLLTALLCLLLCLGPLQASPLPELSPQQQEQLQKSYGEKGLTRIRDWLAAFGIWQEQPTPIQLKAVNDFFNQLTFTTDIEQWGQNDYWASPLEFLGVGGGDCDDFAIAKYFSLRSLGVPDLQLRISYVKSVALDQAHMVLTYYPTPDAIPLVLDNLDPQIKPADQRPDLVPVYSFNGEGLWQARLRGQGTRLGNPEQIQLWQQLLNRMQGEQQP